MTTAQMAYFIAMAEKLNFTTVADMFFVTQPTLSRQIMNLETELNTQLFIRKSGTVVLTPAGQVLYDGLKPLYNQLQLVIDAVVHYEERQKETFTVGIPEELLLDDAVQLAVGVFSVEFPDIRVNITRCSYAKLQQGLLDGSISVANTITDAFDMECGDFDALGISEEPVQLACSAALRKTLPDKSITAEEVREILRKHKLLLAGFDFFGQPSPEYPRQVVQEAFGPFDFDIDLELCDSAISIPSQVAAGLGVSLSNRTNLIAIDPQTAIVEIDVPPGPGTKYSKGLVFARKNKSPSLKRFLEIVWEKLELERNADPQ